MADEEGAKAGKEWLTSWKMGWSMWLWLSKILERCPQPRPGTEKGAAADDDTRLWGKPEMGDEERERGSVGSRIGAPRFGGDDQLRCGCAGQVRRGGD